MNENSRLRPQAIKHQCDAAVDVLEKDNEARGDQRDPAGTAEDGRYKAAASAHGGDWISSQRSQSNIGVL